MSRTGPIFRSSGDVDLEDNSSDRDLLISPSASHSAPPGPIHRVQALLIVIPELVLLVALTAVVFVSLPDEQDWQSKVSIDPVSFRAVLTVVVFVLLALAYQVKRYHNKLARKAGYLHFYRRTRTLVKIPVILWAVLVAFELLVVIFWTSAIQSGAFTSLHAVQALIGLTSLCCVISQIIYAVGVIKHNRERLPPDAASKLLQLDSRRRDDLIGRDDEHLEETQAEYIRYLTDHKNSLTQTVIELRSQIYALQRQSKTAPTLKEVDQILASKDQEIASLTQQLEELKQEQTARSSPKSSEKDLVVAGELANLQEIERLKELLMLEKSSTQSLQKIIARQNAQIEALKSTGED